VTGDHAFFENCHQRKNKAGDKPANHPWQRRLSRLRLGDPPCPCRRSRHTEKQKTRLVDRALKGHRFAGYGHAPLKGFFIQSRIGSFEKAKHDRAPLSVSFY
jgi:hypothetical protein